MFTNEPNRQRWSWIQIIRVFVVWEITNETGFETIEESRKSPNIPVISQIGNGGLDTDYQSVCGVGDHQRDRL